MAVKRDQRNENTLLNPRKESTSLVLPVKDGSTGEHCLPADNATVGENFCLLLASMEISLPGSPSFILFFIIEISNGRMLTQGVSPVFVTETFEERFGFP